MALEAKIMFKIYTTNLHSQMKNCYFTHSLVFHPHKNDIKHLCESGICCGLVDKVLAGQVDIITCAYCQKHCSFMDFTGGGCHNGQQSLGMTQ